MINIINAKIIFLVGRDKCNVKQRQQSRQGESDVGSGFVL